MGIYIYLLAFIIIVNFIIECIDFPTKKKKTVFLLISFSAIFLLYSLRDSSVGRDLPGYKEMYIFTASRRWSDYDYVYFEKGYIFLMKICNSLNFSFQQFLVVVNLIILVPIFIFIGKYSDNPFLSVMIYVCYIFFEFNLTGIRQAIASSIVLIGIMVLIKAKRFGIIFYAVIVYIATLFHSGAFIGFFYIPFHFLKKQKVYVIAIAALALLFLFGRGYILSFIKSVFGKETMNATAGLYIGMNFIFIVCLAVLFVMAQKNREIRAFAMQGVKRDGETKFSTSEELYCFSSGVLSKIFLLSICAMILFGSDNSARSYMFFCQSIFVLLPNCISDLIEKNSQKWVKIGLVFFLIAFFFSNTLISNNFDIVPYKFFGQ